MMPADRITHRFTAWLTERERYEITRLSDELQISQNQVVRIALRAGLGLPVNAGQAASVRIDHQEQAA